MSDGQISQNFIREDNSCNKVGRQHEQNIIREDNSCNKVDIKNRHIFFLLSEYTHINKSKYNI